MTPKKLTGKILFFSDIDETLVNTDKSLSEENRAALEEFLARGNIFVISTGRALSGACNLLKRLGLYGKENLLVSSSNGAIVYDTYREKELLRRPVPRELMIEAFEGNILSLSRPTPIPRLSRNKTANPCSAISLSSSFR